jgi:Ca2+-binding RTX toxin-like protein
VINGVSMGDEAGTSVSGAGDFNDDGLADLVVGARRDDPNGGGSGAAFVVYGKSTTTAVELSDVEAGTGGFIINGVSASDYAGQSVSGAGDVNGDGADDVIVGAYFDDPNGTASGASFVVFGTPAPVIATPVSTDLPLTNVVTVADGTTSFSFVNSIGSSARGVLINNTGSGNFVAANLPDRVTLANAGTDTAQETTPATTLIATQITETADPNNGAAGLLTGAADFMAGKAAGTLFDIRTLTPSVSGAQSLSENIILTGSTDTSGEDAFVIDTRALPTGTVIQLDHIEFAAIVGAVTVTGGAGQNYATGDGSAQNISLGALDDTLFGGGGNDTIGSAFGEDILYGNQGADSMRGGGGMDTVYGGQGNDIVDGACTASRL